MSSFLFIESRDPFEALDVDEGFRVMDRLATSETPVTLFLVQNGVLAARQGAHAAEFTKLGANQHVRVLVDGFALEERGIQGKELAPHVQSSTMAVLVERIMAPDQKVIWH